MLCNLIFVTQSYNKQMVSRSDTRMANLAQKHVADIQYAVQIFSCTCAVSWKTKSTVAIVV